MMDNRLDQIYSVDAQFRDLMTDYRKMFMELDSCLCDIEDMAMLEEPARRSLAIAREKLETSLFYALKTLSLAGERS